MSQPHFLGADQSVIDSFIGLNPNRDLHETYIDIVPVSKYSYTSYLQNLKFCNNFFFALYFAPLVRFA